MGICSKIILILLLSFNVAQGQIAATAARSSRFAWNLLEAMSPTTYNNSNEGQTVVIRNKSFTNLNTGVQQGYNIFIAGADAGNLLNMTIRFVGCYFGPSINVGAQIQYFIGTVIFEDCFFASNRAGILLSECPGVIVRIQNCEFVNVWGAPHCKGQAVQLDNVDIDGESFIKNCNIVNNLGEGSTEDHISLYESNGTSTYYIKVRRNKARGGGPSDSGGGFMSGDTGGSYQLVEENKLVNPGNYIYAISAGTNCIVRNNKGFQDPAISWANIGMYVADIANVGGCGSHTVTGNQINTVGGNPWWDEGACGTITGANPSFTTTNSTSMTEAGVGLPDRLITFVTEDRLWLIREEAVQFRDDTGPCNAAGVPVLTTIHRPTSNAGSDASTSNTAYTLTGGSTSSNGASYRWVQVSGPNIVSMASPTSASNVLNGLVNGVYVFRLEVTDDDGAADADWVIITKTS